MRIINITQWSSNARCFLAAWAVRKSVYWCQNVKNGNEIYQNGRRRRHSNVDPLSKNNKIFNLEDIVKIKTLKLMFNFDRRK